MLVRKGGLEPPRFYPPDPKSGASANSATFATLLDYTKRLVFLEEVFPHLGRKHKAELQGIGTRHSSALDISLSRVPAGCGLQFAGVY